MAAALTSDNELIYASFPVEKVEETPDGDLMVWGKASDGTVDGDLQIVDPDWSLKALREWFDTGANVRVQHQAQRDPAGVGVELDGHYLKALVVEPVAKKLVKSKALGCFSIGISRPDILHGRHPLDPEGKAIGGIITGRKDGSSRIPEVSLVDRGSNFNSKFQLVKAAADGSCEYVGKMIGADDEITKAAHAGDDLVNVDLPKGASITFSPADLAKLSAHRQLAAEREEQALEAVKAAEAGVYKRDIDTATRRRLASQGRALSDGSYPVETHEDADNAVTLALSGHGDTGAAKALIRRIARKEKWQDILDRLDGKKGGTDDASKGADVSGEPEVQEEAAPEVVKADPGDEDGEGAMHHDDGQDDDTDSDADALDKAGAQAPPAGAEKAAMPPAKPKVPCGSCGKKCKPAAKFCPGCGNAMNASKAAGEGVTGTAASGVQAAPEHREPDGPAIEALEHDAGLPEVPDSDCEMKAAARHRSLGVPYDAGWLHDATCPAYDPADVAECYPRRDFSLIDVHAWQAKALDVAATAPLEQARSAMDLWQHARALKTLDPDLAGDLAEEAHKSFTDANPGPGSAPVPSEISASRFARPYISAGHGAPSPGHDAPHTAPIHPGHLSAADYTRSPLTGGHAAPSPGNSGVMAPAAPPAVPGVPSAVSTADIQRRNAAQAMSAMHDHIAATFPDLCPMYGPGHAGQAPSGARPVPAGAGGPAPHGASKAAEGSDPAVAGAGVLAPAEAQQAVTGEKAARKKLRRDLEKAVLKGDIRIDEARRQLGLAPFGFPAAISGKTVRELEPAALKASSIGSLTAAVDPDIIKSAVAEATAPLQEQIAELRKVTDAIASEPDPRVEAYRGPVFNKTPAAAVPQPDARGYEGRVRANVLTAMYDQWRNSSDPGPREEAWQFLLKEAGIDLTKST